MENEIKSRLVEAQDSLARQIGQRIKDLRIARDLSQNQLAGQLGLTRAAVTNWENGQATCNYAQALELERILDTDVVYILYGRDVPDNRAGDGTIEQEFAALSASSDRHERDPWMQDRG